MTKNNFAKVVRIISIPPIMISALVALLWFFSKSYFRNIADMIITLFLLGVFPVLAYPFQQLIPSLKEKGRDEQRKLAFIFTIIGYTFAIIWAFVAKTLPNLKLVCSTYFGSVLLLTICNLFHFKASGHASSFTGPLIILTYEFGIKAAIPCIIFAGLISWSSIVLKRHAWNELFGGMTATLLAFALSYICIIH